MADDHPVRRLQALDVAANALRVELAELPERRTLREHEQEIATLEGRRREAGEELERLQRSERELEAEVADAAARAKSVEDDLYSGRVTAPKELEALQTELGHCRERQGEIEERELELLEAAESVTNERTAMEARCAELEAGAAMLREAIGAAEARIDGELDALATAREGICPEIETRLLETYEKRRANSRLGGIITARLEGDGCGRCRVALPVVEVTRIKAEGPDAFASCPSCQRLILS